MKDVTVVLDLQFGSTGKGQVAGNIATLWGPDAVVCANGPNAGHTFHYDLGETGGKIVHTVLPVCSILPSVESILLGPGAVFDINQLLLELNRIPFGMLKNKHLIIHPNAMLVTQEHRDAESGLVSIGSTMEGTSEAMIEKIRRSPTAHIVRNFKDVLDNKLKIHLEEHGLYLHVSYDHYDASLDFSRRLMVEGAQGAGLSIHSEFYPHCTSRDVSLSQVWADCRLPARQKGDLNVIGVARSYPIRVANRFDADGKQIGTSGGCYADQEEIQWSDLGREPELTTVTRLPRRLFTFSTRQIIEAAQFCAPTAVALTFCDYLELPLYGFPPTHTPGAPVSPAVESLVRRIEAAAGCDVAYLNYGPLPQHFYSFDTRYDKEQKLELTVPRLPWEV